MVLAALALVAAIPASAADEWRKVDPAAVRTADPARLEQLSRDYPYSAAVRLALLNTYLEAGRNDEAWREIEFLASRGYVFSAAGQAALLGLYEGDARAKLAELFAAERAPIEASQVLAMVPAEAELVEALAWDEGNQLLFASTVVTRALYQRDPEGHWRRIEFTEGGSLGGLAYDAANEMVWIASGVYDQTPHPETAFRGLIGYSASNGEKTKIAAPADATPGDIAIGERGRLYASDPLNGAIYTDTAPGGRLGAWIAPGTFRSPQGLVPWNGGLIVSDYGYGLAFVDREGKAWRIESDVPALLDGIDGMWRRGDKIVAIQNGARPARIVELSMSADGLRVTGIRELERAHPAWTEPLGGTIVGDSLVYVGTGQWAAFGPGGDLREGASTSPTELRSLPLLESPAPPP